MGISSYLEATDSAALQPAYPSSPKLEAVVMRCLKAPSTLRRRGKGALVAAVATSHPNPPKQAFSDPTVARPLTPRPQASRTPTLNS